MLWKHLSFMESFAKNVIFIENCEENSVFKENFAEIWLRIGYFRFFIKEKEKLPFFEDFAEN